MLTQKLLSVLILVGIASSVTGCGFTLPGSSINITKDTVFVDHKIGGSKVAGDKLRFVTTDADVIEVPSIIEAQVVESIDGDTFRFSSPEINKKLSTETKKKGDLVYTIKGRMLYSDTPETVKAGIAKQCQGQEASDWTKKQLMNKKVYLAFDKGPVDVKYQRALIFVFLKKQDAKAYQDSPSDITVSKSLNYEIITSGKGQVTAFSPNTTFKKLFTQAELIAKTKKIGVWQCPDPFKK
jgi:endonuclease YncB( thermonuclease family)